MSPRDSNSFSAPTWLTLLGPLPLDVTPSRQPVASPELLASPNGAAIAGWEKLVLHLSAGAAGLRIVLVVLDANGVLLSASDSVLYRTAANHTGASRGDGPEMMLQLSVGGRFEDDGSFHGTRWHSVAADPDTDEEPAWESTPSEPSPDDVDGLRAVVAELIRRQPPRA